MNPRLILAAILLASPSLSCLAHDSAAPAAPASQAHARAALSVDCSLEVAARLDDLSAKSRSANSKWSANQRYQLEDAIATARSTRWGLLDSESAAMERQAARVRSGDDLQRASAAAQEARHARELYPDTTTRQDSLRAAEAARAASALWTAQSNADASALHYARCLWAPSKR